MNPRERQVVITGCGVLTPLGDDVGQVFSAVCAGNSATGLDAGYDTTGSPSRVVGVLPEDTNLTFGMRKDQSRYFRKNRKVMCRDTQLAGGASSRAIHDAGLPLGEPKTQVLPSLDHARFGILFGSGYIPAEIDMFGSAGQASLEDGEVSLNRWGSDGAPLLFPLWLLKFLPNMPACHVGIIWDCQGPSNSITCNEASSLLAIGEGFRHVARGTGDTMLVGGGESKLNPSWILRHCLLGTASTGFNDRPAEAHRPFDADRDGLVPAEGAGAMLLEPADLATEHGTQAKARLLGFGSACATTLPNEVETSGASIARAMRFALRDAGIGPEDIDLVVAHGMAVPDQDVAEARAVAEVLDDTPVTCFTGGMGNIGSAGGAVDVALACRILGEGRVPPIRNCDRLDPRCPIQAVTGEAVERSVETIMVISSGIASQSGALVMQKV